MASIPTVQRDVPLRSAARQLLQSRRSMTPIDALPEALRPRDIGEGYALQQALGRELTAAGLGRRVGHKIGCTTGVMQRYLGIGHPCAGTIYEHGVLRSGARVSHGRFVKVGIECEIAVEIGEDLRATGRPYDRDSVVGSVKGLMPAIEIVDDRYRDFSTLGAPTLIADDFFNSGCVLGVPVAGWSSLDLAALSGAILVDGVEVGRGTGADVMGHPFNALAWLANARLEQGLPPLRAGEFVLLGSLVRTQWPPAGVRTRIEIDGLGALDLAIDA